MAPRAILSHFHGNSEGSGRRMIKQGEIPEEMLKPKSNRNPIKFHGNRPGGSFTQVPNELARDNTLSTDARMTAILLLSHDEGFEVSAASLAEDMNRNRKTVFKALRQLDGARRVITQTYLTAAGKQAFQVYHVRRAGQFTEEEAAQLRVPFRLPAPVRREDAGKSHAGTGESPRRGRQEVPGRDYKEHHLEHQAVERAEESPLAADSCVLCRKPIGNDDAMPPARRIGLGITHEPCLTRWFFESSEGMAQFLRMRDSGKTGHRLAATFERKYLELLEEG